MLFFCINQQNQMTIVRQHQNVKTTSSKIAMPVHLCPYWVFYGPPETM